MPEPVFNENDIVEVRTTGDLPAELRGVTDPVKIAQYYQTREKTILKTAREAIAAAPPKNGEPPSRTVVMTRDTDKPPAVTEAEIVSSRATMITTAMNQAKQGKQWWDKFENDIRTLVGKCPVEQQLDIETWNVAYFTIMGMNQAKVKQWEKEAADEATRIATERSTAAATTEATPTPLPPKVTNSILPGLGISEDRYRKAQEQISKGEWPLTMNNAGAK